MDTLPGRKIILIADDDFEDQELLEEAIMAAADHISIQKVSDGKETLEFLGQCSAADMPCAIVLDYSMPGLNGLDVLKVIFNDQRFAAVSIFMWSTSNASVHATECLNNGALNYFVKPDHPKALKAIVSEILIACRG